MSELPMTLPSSHGRRQRRDRPVRAARSPVAADGAAAVGGIDRETRLTMICDAAYFLAERRGFASGHELDDWLAAEKQIDLALTSGHAATAGGGREA
jgi:hypothetical protein